MVSSAACEEQTTRWGPANRGPEVRLLCTAPPDEDPTLADQRLTLLRDATSRGQAGMVAMLLLSLRDLNVNGLLGRRRRCALHVACVRGFAGIVALLVGHPGIELNLLDDSRRTPLYLACRHRRFGVVNLLLRLDGVRADIGGEGGLPPLIALCEDRQFQLAALILDRTDVNVNSCHKNDQATALHYACRAGDLDFVKQLVNCPGLNFNALNDEHETPFFAACLENEDSVMEFLLNVKGVKLNIAEMHGITPLHILCYAGKLAFAKMAMRRTEVNVNARAECGSLPIHAACRADNFECLNALVKIGKIDLSRFTGQHHACNKCSTNMACLMMLYSDADQRLDSWDVAYCRQVSVQLVRLMMEFKVKVKVYPSSGRGRRFVWLKRRKVYTPRTSAE